jgi:hypothetical protein
LGDHYNALDIETRDWSVILCVCSLDEFGEKIVAWGIRDWIEQARGKNLLRYDVVHFAHFGGGFDFIFFLEELLPEWELVSGLAGGGFGLWCLELRGPNGEWLRLRDSFRLMPYALDAIGKSFGFTKWNGLDRSCMGLEWDNGEHHAIVDYCIRDCGVLLVSLLSYRGVWRALGVDCRTTTSATAATQIRLVVPNDAWGWNHERDRAVESCYHGGRTERFAASLGPGRSFDIASSYPAAMLRALPTRLVRSQLGKASKRSGEKAIYQAVVKVPSDVAIPPLPYLSSEGALKGKLLFPTGEFRGLFCDEELDCATLVGSARVVKIEKTWIYDSAEFMADFVAHWYDRKSKTDSDAVRFISKIVLNSCYGKLVEHPERETVTSSESRITRMTEKMLSAELAGDRDAVVVRKCQDILTKSGTVTLAFMASTKDGPLRHIAAGTYVTARGRVRLYHGILEALKTGTVAYCDTDSVYTDGTLHTSPGVLGEFNCDSEFISAEFLRPKLYAAESLKTSPQCPGSLYRHLTVKAKGMRLPKEQVQLREAWNDIREGRPVVTEVVRRLKGQVKHKDLRFTRETLSRHINPGYDKRAFDAHGQSRPWAVEELAGLKVSDGRKEREE